MKEVTAKNWNYKPRDMYVWDDASDHKKIMYVLSILQSDKKHPINAPVIAAGKQGWPVFFRHCAEIEQESKPVKKESLPYEEVYELAEELSHQRENTSSMKLALIKKLASCLRSL